MTTSREPRVHIHRLNENGEVLLVFITAQMWVGRDGGTLGEAGVFRMELRTALPEKGGK